MSEIDYIVQDLIIEKEGKLNVQQLYKTLRAWFNANKYFILEKEYKDILKTGSSDLNISWEAIKKADDYTKLKIRVMLTGSEIKKTESNNIVEGNMNIKFESLLETDYEDKWEGNPLFKFVRSLFDKFGKESTRSSHENDLKEATYDLYNKIKSFLSLEKF